MSQQEEEQFKVVGSKILVNGSYAPIKYVREGRELPKGEVGCKICNKSIHQIFVEHLEQHLK